jgi:hypothetical protein
MNFKMWLEQEEHVGDWYHGGRADPPVTSNFLYVTDEIDEAEHYANMKGGGVWRLKPEYHHLVSWALGQSEGMIPQSKVDFDKMFEPV